MAASSLTVRSRTSASTSRTGVSATFPAGTGGVMRTVKVLHRTRPSLDERFGSVDDTRQDGNSRLPREQESTLLEVVHFPVAAARALREDDDRGAAVQVFESFGHESERLAYRALVVHRDVAVQPQHHPEQRPFVDAAFGHPFEVNLRQHVHQRDVHHGLVIDRHHVGAFRVDVFPSFHAEPPERVQEEDAPCPETRRRMERLPFPVERHGEREKQEHEDEVGERPRQQDEVV